MPLVLDVRLQSVPVSFSTPSTISVTTASQASFMPGWYIGRSLSSVAEVSFPYSLPAGRETHRHPGTKAPGVPPQALEPWQRHPDPPSAPLMMAVFDSGAGPQVATDAVEHGCDDRAQDYNGGNHDNRDQRQKQSILDEVLTVLVLPQGFERCEQLYLRLRRN